MNRADSQQTTEAGHAQALTNCIAHVLATIEQIESMGTEARAGLRILLIDLKAVRARFVAEYELPTGEVEPTNRIRFTDLREPELVQSVPTIAARTSLSAAPAKPILPANNG